MARYALSTEERLPDKTTCASNFCCFRTAQVPPSIGRSKAIFVFSDSEAAAAMSEDRLAVIRTLMLRKFLSPSRMRNVSVQASVASRSTMCAHLIPASEYELDTQWFASRWLLLPEADSRERVPCKRGSLDFILPRFT